VTKEAAIEVPLFCMIPEVGEERFPLSAILADREGGGDDHL